MLKIIHADLYKAFHRMYLYVTMAILAAGCILYNIICASMGQKLEAGLGGSMMLIGIPLYLMTMFADIITAEENKEHTLKNTVSFGVSRGKLYLAKNISAIIITLVVAVVTFLFFVGGAFALLKPGDGYSMDLLNMLGKKVAVAMVVYIAGVVMATLFAFIMKRNSLFAFSYFGALIFPPIIFQLLSIKFPSLNKIGDSMLLSLVNLLPNATDAQMMNTIWITLAHIAVFVIIGLIVFRKQEIN